jgi:hypothetical protein
MKSLRCCRFAVAFLLASLLVRAGLAATMPIQMLVMQTQAGAEVIQVESSDCPGHAASALDGVNQSDCSFCGECCVTAPLLTFDPSAYLAHISPQTFDGWLTLPPMSYLTPGIDRPPAV